MLIIEKGSNQRNKDLSGADLSGQNLTGVDFTGANLSGADFSGAYLAGTNFVNTNLSNADFSDANFESNNSGYSNSGYTYSANFNGANLNGCNFYDTYVISANFVNTNFEEALIEGANFSGCGFDAEDVSYLSEYVDESWYSSNISSSIVLSEHIQNFNVSLDEVNGAIDVSFTVNQPFYDYYQFYLDYYNWPVDDLTLDFITVDDLMPIFERVQIEIPVDNENIPFDFSQSISLPDYLSGREIQLSQVYVALNITSVNVQYYDHLNDGFGRELGRFDLFPNSERDAPVLDIAEITILALSDTEFSSLVADEQYKDVYGVNIQGSYTDESALDSAFVHFQTREYLNEDKTSYATSNWRAKITSDDIDSDGNFNTTFFAPQQDPYGENVNIIGQFDEVHVDGVVVMDEYFNIGKAVLVEDLIISDNIILPENYALGEDFPIGGLNLQTTSYNTTTDNNLFPYYPVNYHLSLHSSFDDSFVINFNDLYEDLVFDPNGDQISILNNNIRHRVWEEFEDGSIGAEYKIYNGSSLEWIGDGILRVAFNDDVDLDTIYNGGNPEFNANMNLTDGSFTKNLSASVTFMPNLYDLAVTGISIDNNNNLKLAMNQPLNLTELGDGSQSYSLHFEDIYLYTEGTYFRFEGTGHWTGDGYSLELPAWVPDGEFIFAPHHYIADVRGDDGDVASRLKLITPNNEIIKLSIDRPNSAIDVSGPSITGVETLVSEIDSKHIMSISGTIEDTSAVEHVIFKVTSDYSDRSVLFDGSNINQDGSFSFQYQFENVQDPSTIEAWAVFAFDEFGNGTHQKLVDRYSNISYRNYQSTNESSASDSSEIFVYLTTGQEIQDSEHYSHLTNETFGLGNHVSLTNYSIQPADWMSGKSGIGWLSVDSESGALYGTIEGLNDYWQADYNAFAQDNSGNTYKAEISILTNPFLDEDGELFLNYHHWSNWGQEGTSLTGAFANLSADSYTLTDGRILAPNMVLEPDGTFFFAPESQDSFFHGNRFDDVFIGDDIGSPRFMWTGGNDKFIGAEGVTNHVDFGWYEEYVTREFGNNQKDGLNLSIDSETMIATTHFGVLEATNIKSLANSELNDVIALQNMDFFRLYNRGGSDIINANNIQVNAKLYQHNGVASKYVINDYNQSSVIRIDDGITKGVLGLDIGADYEAATSVYRTNGKTYVDLIGTNNQSIEKIVTLDGDYGLNEIKDKGSDGFELRFFNLNPDGTDSNDYLGPLGKWDRKDTNLNEYDVTFNLNGHSGNDTIGGGKNNDILNGGEEQYFNEFGWDTYENGQLSMDQITYVDFPSGIYANLINGTVEDGYGSFDVISNFERMYGTFYDDIIIMSNNLHRGYIPNYGNDKIYGWHELDMPNNSYLGYWHLDRDSDVTDTQIIANYDEGKVTKIINGGEFAGTYEDTFTGYIGGIIGSRGDDVLYGLSSGADYVPVAGFYSDDLYKTLDLGYGILDGNRADDTLIALGTGKDRLVGGEGDDLIISFGHGETDKVSGQRQNSGDISSSDYDTFVIGGSGSVIITDYEYADNQNNYDNSESIILLDYLIRDLNDLSFEYLQESNQTQISILSDNETLNNRIILNGSFELDSFNETLFLNDYVQGTIIDNQTKDFEIKLKPLNSLNLTKEDLSLKEDHQGGSGNDKMDAGDLLSNLKLHGGRGADQLFGGKGHDKIDGGDDNDWLKGGKGHDYILGGKGSDILELEADGIWEDKYKAKNMGDDGSTLGIGTGQEIGLGGKNKFEDVLDGGEDSDLLKLTDTSDAFFLHDSFSGFYEEVDKSLTDHEGMASAKRVLSVETIDAGGGDDIVDLTSSLFNMDEISGMVVDGGLGNDVIWASSGDDDLRGGEGNDILFGGKGTDTLTGGSGSDMFQFTLSSGQDTITDFNISEGDKIQLWKGSNDSNTVTYTQNGNDTIITWQDVRIDVNMDHTIAAQHVEWMTIV